MARTATTIIVLIAEVALLGYGVYPFMDRRGWAILLVPAFALLFVVGRVWRAPTWSIIAGYVALVVSLLSAVGAARGNDHLAIVFAAGLEAIKCGAALIHPLEYDPIGHPLLWGLGLITNTLVIAAVLLGAGFTIARAHRALSHDGG